MTQPPPGRRQEARHATRMEALSKQCQPRRRPRAQRRSALRDPQRSARVAAVRFLRWVNRYYQLTVAQASRFLRVAPRTLWRWIDAWKSDRLIAPRRGRAPCKIDPATRRSLIDYLRGVSPGVSVQSLRDRFPQLPRRALQSVRQRWRRLAARTHIFRVRWTRPGAVWATDFTEPPAPIDGKYPYILNVRDLASGLQLLALPTADETADTALAAMRSLFAAHAAPLVLKSDNGAAFKDRRFTALLGGHGAHWMPSPPRTPTYNGACEAGNGAMKARAHHRAACNARPGHWSCDDLEFARLEANATARPNGPGGPTPDEAWRNRTPITDRERRRFADSVREQQWQFTREAGYTTDRDQDPTTRGLEQRVSVRRALGAHDLYEVRGGPFTLPFKRRKRAKIT